MTRIAWVAVLTPAFTYAWRNFYPQTTWYPEQR